jgi:hypothetical protein
MGHALVAPSVQHREGIAQLAGQARQRAQAAGLWWGRCCTPGSQIGNLPMPIRFPDGYTTEMNPTQLGPYTIQSRLGRGGMGAVYEAVDTTTGDTVAVKVLASHLADDEGVRSRFEAEIDALNAGLAPLTSFILPGGSEGAARVHLGRSIARRAERAATALAASEPVNPAALAYLNRLSDYLFVLARATNAGNDPLWVPGGSR